MESTTDMSYAQHVHYALRMHNYQALGLMSEADASLAVNREWHFMGKEHKKRWGEISWWTVLTMLYPATGHSGGPMEVDEVEGSGETKETVEETGEGAETKETSVALKDVEEGDEEAVEEGVDEDDEKEN